MRGRPCAFDTTVATRSNRARDYPRTCGDRITVMTPAFSLVRLSAVAALAATLSIGSARGEPTAAATAMLERELAAEVERFVAADRLAPPAPCQVLFVGSSSIVKWRATLPADMAPMPVV